MNTPNKTLAMILTGLALVVFTISGTSAQYADPRAAEIIETAWQEYERSIENIDDYVVETDLFTIYYKKVYENGRPYFRARTETDIFGGLESTTTTSDADMFTPDTYDMLKRNARYEGREDVEGFQVHVLYVERIEGMFPDAEDILEEGLEEMRVYIDTDDWVIRKISYLAEAEVEEGELRQIEPEIMFRDYRRIEGMMIAFETTTVVTGLSASLTDEERREAEESLREMERELEQMSEQERGMVERILGNRMESFREMLEQDRFEFTVRVNEVRVNTGLE